MILNYNFFFRSLSLCVCVSNAHIAKQRDLATLKHKGTLSAPWLQQWRHFPTCRRTLIIYPCKLPMKWVFSKTNSLSHTHTHETEKKLQKIKRFYREKKTPRTRRENGNCSINITSIVNLKQCSYFAFAINKISCSIYFFGCAIMAYVRVQSNQCGMHILCSNAHLKHEMCCQKERTCSINHLSIFNWWLLSQSKFYYSNAIFG